jgi:uncharacterized protein
MKTRGPALALALLLALSPQVMAAAQGLDALPFEKKLQLAKVGDPDARIAVAEAYEKGDGVALSAAEAAKWYRQAALAGSMEAQFRLAKLVSKGAPGLKSDKSTAYKLFLTAAQKGHAPSQNEVGLMLQNGVGIAKDEKVAVDWYRKAADQGLATAENNLGVMLLNAQGAARNVDDAFKYFTKAAAQNDIWGLNNLGAMYQKGWGTQADIEKAKLYFKKAADLGNETAKSNLAKLEGSVAVVPKAN